MEDKITKPSIAEIEAILSQEEDVEIEILPNGEVRAKDKSSGEPKPLTMRESLGGEYSSELPPLTIVDIINAIGNKGVEFEWQALRRTALSVRANRKAKEYGEVNFACNNKYANDLFRSHDGAEYFPVVLWLPRKAVDGLIQEK